MSNVNTYKNALSDAYKKKQKDKLTTDEKTENLLGSANALEKTLGVAQEFKDDMQRGVLKGLEGILDAGLSIGAWTFSLFGTKSNKLSKLYEKGAKADLTENAMNLIHKGDKYKIDRKIYKAEVARENNLTNYLPNVIDSGAKEVTQSIGQMLPSIAMGGIGGEALSLTTMGISAGGNSAVEALNEGNSLNRSLAYGTLEGLKETATEKAFGLVGGKIGGVVGKSTVSKEIAKSTVRDVFKEVGKEFVEEGAEEALGDLFEPLIKKATIDTDLKLGEAYTSPEFYKEMAHDFIVGAITGGIMSGTSTATNVATKGLNNYLSELDLQKVRNITEDYYDKYKTGKITEQDLQKAQKQLEDVFGKAVQERMNKVATNSNSPLSNLTKLENDYRQGKAKVEDVVKARQDALEQVSKMDMKEISKDKVRVARYLNNEVLNTIAQTGNITSQNAKDLSLAFQKRTGKNLKISTLSDEELAKRFEKFEAGVDNAFTDQKGNVYVSRDALTKNRNKTLYNLVQHELTHNVDKATVDKMSNKLLNGKFSFNVGLGDDNISTRITNDNWKNIYRERYQKNIKGMSNEEANDYLKEELLADYLGSKLGNHKKLANILGQRSSFANFFNNLFNRGSLQEQIRSGLETGRDTENDKYRSSKELDNVDYEDSEGNDISKSMALWNKDNKFRDELGRVLRLYHGSTMAGFMEFNDEKPIFLTPSFDVAYSYGENMNVVNTTRYTNAEDLINDFYDNYSDADGIEDILPINETEEGRQYVEKMLEEWKSKKGISNFPQELVENRIKFLETALKEGYVASYTEDGETVYEVFNNGDDLIRRFQEVNQQTKNIDETMNDTEDPKGNRIYALYAKSTNPIVIDCKYNNYTNIMFRGKRMSTDEIAEIIKEEGENDGIIFENIIDNGAIDMFNENGAGDVYVVFKANQVKAVDNPSPTEDNDIRFSKDTTSKKETAEKEKTLDEQLLEDFNNNYDETVAKINENLPNQVKEFFKDSIVKSNSLDWFDGVKDGKYLIPMFHGTPNFYMNFFDSSRIGENGTARGFGMYLTDNINYASSYTSNSGKMIVAFVNITKPMSDTSVTVTREQVEKFIRRYVDRDGDGLLGASGIDAYSDYDGAVKATLDRLFEYEKNDVDIINEMYVNSGLEYRDFFNAVNRFFGFDGALFKNRAEGTIAIVFKSNQVKYITNQTPTDDLDFRFSKDATSKKSKTEDKKVEDIKKAVKLEPTKTAFGISYNNLLNKVNELYKEKYNNQVARDKIITQKLADYISSMDGDIRRDTANRSFVYDNKDYHIINPKEIKELSNIIFSKLKDIGIVIGTASDEVITTETNNNVADNIKTANEDFNINTNITKTLSQIDKDTPSKDVLQFIRDFNTDLTRVRKNFFKIANDDYKALKKLQNDKATLQKYRDELLTTYDNFVAIYERLYNMYSNIDVYGFNKELRDSDDGNVSSTAISFADMNLKRQVMEFLNNISNAINITYENLRENKSHTQILDAFKNKIKALDNKKKEEAKAKNEEEKKAKESKAQSKKKEVVEVSKPKRKKGASSTVYNSFLTQMGYKEIEKVSFDKSNLAPKKSRAKNDFKKKRDEFYKVIEDKTATQEQKQTAYLEYTNKILEILTPVVVEWDNNLSSKDIKGEILEILVSNFKDLNNYIENLNMNTLEGKMVANNLYDISSLLTLIKPRGTSWYKRKMQDTKPPMVSFDVDSDTGNLVNANVYFDQQLEKPNYIKVNTSNVEKLLEEYRNTTNGDRLAEIRTSIIEEYANTKNYKVGKNTLTLKELIENRHSENKNSISYNAWLNRARLRFRNSLNKLNADEVSMVLNDITMQVFETESFKKGERYNKLVNQTATNLKELKEISQLTFADEVNINQLMPTELVGFAMNILQAKGRGRSIADLKKVATTFNEIKAFLNDNEILQGILTSSITSGKKGGDVDTETKKSIMEYVDELTTYNPIQKKLSYNQVSALNQFVKAVRAVVNKAMNITVNGEKVKAQTYAQKVIDDKQLIDKNVLYNSKGKLRNPIYRIYKWTIDNMVDVFNRITQIQKTNKKGLYTDFYNELVKAQDYKYELLDKFSNDKRSNGLSYVETIEKNQDRLRKDKVTLSNGVVIDGDYALTLYMLSKREQALKHIHKKVEQVKNKKGELEDKVIYNGEGFKILKNRTLIGSNYVDFDALSQKDLDILADYGEKNKEVVDVIKSIMQDSENLFVDFMDKKWGYSIKTDKNYFRIETIDGYKNSKTSDVSSRLLATKTLTPSFYKQVDANANNKILVRSVFDVVNDYVMELSSYVAVNPVAMSYDRVMNSQVKVNGRELSLHNYINEIDGKLNSYMDEVFAYELGIRGQKSTINRFFGKIRANIGKATLGANVKVMFQQLASHPMLLSVMDFADYKASLGVGNARSLYTSMCNNSYFKNRFEGNGIANATLLIEDTKLQGVGNRITRFGNLFMKPLSLADTRVMLSIYRGAINHIARENNMDYKQLFDIVVDETLNGDNLTEEQKKNKALRDKALQLAEMWSRQTQPQYDGLENGRITHIDNEVLKGGLMYSSVTRKYLSRLYGVWAEFSKNKTQDNLKVAVKTTTGFVLSQSMLTVVALLISRGLLGRDKDKDLKESAMVSLVDNLTINSIPLLNQFSSQIKNATIARVVPAFKEDTYELSNPILDSFNELQRALNGLIDADWTDRGEATKAVYTSTTAISKLLGLPVKTVSKEINDFTNQVSSGKVQLDSIAFGGSSSSSNRSSLLSEVDTNLAKGRTSIAVNTFARIFDDSKMSTPSKDVLKELVRLYSLEYKSIIPSTEFENMTIDGNKYKLTEKAQKKFANIYSQANEVIENLIASSYYKDLEDKEKASLIKKLYNAYYDIAKQEVVSETYELNVFAKCVSVYGGDNLVEYMSNIDKYIDKGLEKKDAVLKVAKTISKSNREHLYNLYGYKTK